jgi:hypothetical protein
MRSCAPPALSRLVPRFLALCAISCAMVLAGCARNPAQRGLDPGLHEVKAAPVRAAGRILRSPERYRSTGPQLPRLRQPDPALLALQPAPDCEYKRSDLKTVDPDEWARLRVEFERECYQRHPAPARLSPLDNRDRPGDDRAAAIGRVDQWLDVFRGNR